MKRKYTSYESKAHNTEKEARDYTKNFLEHHLDEKDVLIVESFEPRLNTYGFWESKVKYRHN